MLSDGAVLKFGPKVSNKARAMSKLVAFRVQFQFSDDHIRLFHMRVPQGAYTSQESLLTV